MTKVDLTSQFTKNFPSAISVCTDMDDEDLMVLDWSNQNNALAQQIEVDLRNRFEQMVQSLDIYEVSEHTTSGKPRINPIQLGSMRSIFLSNSSFPRADSCTSLAEVQSVASNLNKGVNRVANKMKAMSIAPTKTEKVTCIPSGFERDLVEFHKYNALQ